ncbi:MAG: fluoride efflux transporter CrcB [Gemmataceae bacterium]
MANWFGAFLTHDAVSVSIGAALGANARYWIGLWFKSFSWGEHFPWGTVFVNVSGSFFLAAFVVLLTEKFTPPQKSWLLLLGTGFCGSYTTFSTFGVETFNLLEAGRHWAALGYVAISIVAGLAAVMVTYWTLRGGFLSR